MTKSIASYPVEQRKAVITRRLKVKTRGSGYWAARRAALILGIPVPKDSKPFKQRVKDTGDNDESERKRKRPTVTRKGMKNAFKIKRTKD